MPIMSESNHALKFDGVSIGYPTSLFTKVGRKMPMVTINLPILFRLLHKEVGVSVIGGKLTSKIAPRLGLFLTVEG